MEKMKEATKVDAVIIGGGLTGLTAANYLAQAGQSVILVEKAEQLGGRAQTTNKNHVLLNFGPHALFTAGVGVKILTELGCQPTGGSPSQKMLGIRDGKLITLPTGISSMLSSGAFSLREKLEFAKWMTQLTKLSTEAWLGVSLKEWVMKHIRHERVRQYFYALFRLWTYGMDPEKQSAGYALKQGQLALQGVLYVDGGWQSIVDRLREKAWRAGVQIMTGYKADQVVHQNGKVHSVRFSNGESTEASAIIIASNPHEACRLVEGSENMSLGKWKQECVPLYGACLDLVLKRVPYPKREFAIGIDEPIYFSNHSTVIPLSKNGETVIHAMKYKGSKKDSDARADEKQLTRLLDLLQAGWDKEVVEIRYLPNMLIASDYRSFRHQGAGVASGPAVKEISGLYVAGDWVGTEGRLAETAMSSAKQAAREVFGQLRP